MSFDLSTLNPEQIKPVLDTEGAVLVTAGAGSGKTRLLTHRIAHIISDLGVPAYNVLAITFTNKAAGEMRERLERMVPDANGLWVSTFHSMCATFLRKFIDKIGYTTNFSIYGENEKERAVKRIIKEKNIEDDIYKKVMAAIGDAKNDGLDPEQYYLRNNFAENAEEIRDVYHQYEAELKKCIALDFDDLLNKAYYLLKHCPEAGDYYAGKFRYIHVDEFQDTNVIQYKIVRELARVHKNVLIVGDEDQSIYGWRGASVSNIYDFTKDFDCKIYKLEQNYRSTKKIITLANMLIENNTSRIKKKLWTDNGGGDDVEIACAQSENQEADFVVGKIVKMVRDDNYRYSDFAVLMRINALTRPFEEKFLQYGIPHKVFGGFKFYERKEIKDILAYLRIIVNPFDNEAILRVINFPKRGIGDAAISQLVSYALVKNCSFFGACMACLEKPDDFPAALVKKVSPFSTVLKCLASQADQIPHSDLAKYLVKMLNLKEVYGAETEENENRKQNIKELISAINSYEKLNPGATLEEYLQNVSLYSDLDEMSEDESCVSLATIHSAKGLEFKVVFVVGAEEGIFPVTRSMDSTSDIEEERRLMYVAVTRAMEKLYITYSASRFLYSERKASIPSRFLKELGYSAPAFEPQKSMYGEYAESRWYNRSNQSNNYNGANKNYDTSDSQAKKSFIKPSSGQYQGDLVIPQPPPVAEKKAGVRFEAFVQGAKVKHKKFGIGTVLNVTGAGDNSYALIEFDVVGKLTLSLAYAPLEVVDDE